MASTPSAPNRDTLRDLLPIWMWDDEKPKPIGAIDHDGWSYIYYGLHYDRIAAMNGVAFDFAHAANSFVQNAQAANTATVPTPPPPITCPITLVPITTTVAMISPEALLVV